MVKSVFQWVLLPTAAAVLIACGGGGGDSAVTGASTSNSITMTGVAAYGAPYPAGSKITVRDATGTVVISEQEITSADGSYKLVIPASAVAPLLISVAAEELPSLTSFVPEKANGTANVTPITNLIAAHLSNSGNPADLAKELAAGRQVAAADVAAKTAEVKNILAPLLDAVGVTDDPLTGTLVANGTGMDRVLDALKLDVIPAGSTTNILVGLKTALDETDTPLEMGYQKVSGTELKAPTLASLTSASALAARLAPAGVSVKISDWVSRMVSCHAENIDSRVNLKNSNSASAANITSPVCKSLFLNSDPSNYLSNGFQVTGKDHFTGIFWDGGTGLQISNPQLEYIVKNGNTTDPTKPMNGDVVFSYRWRTADDKTDVSVAQGRISSVDNKLYLTGNLSSWDVWVNPRMEKRVFTQTNMSTRTYINTGYSVYANASKHGNSAGYIKVTTPSGKTLHLKRRSGYDYYVLVGSQDANATTGLTSIVRLAANYLDSTQTGQPRDMDTNLFWASNPDTGTGDWTESQISAIPNQGNWKFEIYSTVGGTLLGTTVRRTIARAPTLQEVKAVNWPQITQGGLDKIAATTNTTSGSVLIRELSDLNLADASGGAFWSVDANTSWLPTGARASGAYFPNGFCSSTDVNRVNWVNGACVKENTTDDVRFKSTLRKVTIPCSNQGGSDQHCASGKFKANNAYSFSTLWGFDARRVESSLSLDTRKAL
jgi:hypothetical protein